MSKSKATNIVRLDWLSNRTLSGRRSATKARKLAQYFALGRGREKEQEQRPQRGEWLDQAGRLCSHEEVLQWVRQQGMSHEMTYQFILSVKETQLTDEAFSRAMAAGGPLFAEWRLIQHDDSRYPHAHALAFGNQPVQIKSEAFQSWWLAVRQALEREQANAQEMQQEAALEQTKAAALQQGAGLEHEDAVSKPPRSNQVLQEANHEQKQNALEQDGATLGQAAHLDDQLDAESAEPALEYTVSEQSWDMEL
jgi:predicted transcriptional regulator